VRAAAFSPESIVIEIYLSGLMGAIFATVGPRVLERRRERLAVARAVSYGLRDIRIRRQGVVEGRTTYYSDLAIQRLEADWVERRNWSPVDHEAPPSGTESHATSAKESPRLQARWWKLKDPER